MVDLQTRREIYNELEESLPWYRAFKGGKDVNEVFSVFLKELDPEIMGYIFALPPVEQEAIELWLDNKPIEKIIQYRKFKENKVSKNEVNQWLFGDREELGFVNIMFHVFMQKIDNYCPFCHDKLRGGSSAPGVKLNGNPCPHMEKFHDEKEKE